MICSDGITIDDSTAMISEVVVSNVLTQPGVFKDAVSNEVYVLHENREIEKLVGPTSECV